MIIKTLVENRSISPEFKNEHGLSLYIETKQHKLLFDLGASALFAENAEKMGVDLAEIDLVVISHGHYDHGGGLETLMKVNTKAKIYLNQKAFDKHYANRASGEKAYIGLDEKLRANDRFVFVDDYLLIDEELELFANVPDSRFKPSGNQDLLMGLGNSLVQDDFAHEQNLIIQEQGKTVLAAGCAHKGIVNIVDHFRTVKNCFPSHILGGFHLYNLSRDRFEDPAVVRQIGEYLQDTGAKYYTGHCTGIEPYKILQGIMGEKRIEYLATGSQLTIS